MSQLLYEGDLLIFNTLDGGDIEVIGGEPTRDGGIQTAVYLKLFGGNLFGEEWWGDIIETDEVAKMPGEMQSVMNGYPMTSATIPSMRAAAISDLAPLKKDGIIGEYEVIVSIGGPKKVLIDVVIEGYDTLKYAVNWRKSL